MDTHPHTDVKLSDGLQEPSPEGKALPLVIIIDNKTSTDEHARKSVREILKRTFDPYAPRIPEQADVYVRRTCSFEGHSFWCRMDFYDQLCPVHRADPEVRAMFND